MPMRDSPRRRQEATRVWKAARAASRSRSWVVTSHSSKGGQSRTKKPLRKSPT